MSEIVISDETELRYWESKLTELRDILNGVPPILSYFEFTSTMDLLLKEDEMRRNAEQKMTAIMVAIKAYYMGTK